MIMNILIVDDKPENLYTLREILKQVVIPAENLLSSINVIEASGGNDALSIAMKENVDLIILDIQMPDMDGFEVAKYLKKGSKTRGIPVVFLTAAFKEEEFMHHGYSLGAIDYFIKPVEKHQFINKIQLYMNLYCKTKALDSLNKNLQIKVIEEVNKYKEKEQQLLQQSRLAQMGEMISMIAHQWRQPLSSISSTSIDMQIKLQLDTYDLTLDEGRAEAKSFFLDRLSFLDTLVQNLSTTIDDFRDFYKPNKKLIEMKTQDIVTKSLYIIEAILNDNNIEIIKEFNDSKPMMVYNNEIMQVILNILKNAQDNFEEKKINKPYIKIRTEDNSISISDNGRGISPEIMEKIFEPYFSTKNEKNGTGLGLYMSKIIVEEHHKGTLHVENLDDGVCFRIELGELLAYEE